jgi:hypothetical protein
VSIALLVATGAKVDALVPFYAIGVFTGFTMAGLGMAKYHGRVREERWHGKFTINLAGGLLSALVVLIFVVTKFKEPHRWEGAWLVVVLFPILTYALIRLNRRYRREEQVLEAVGDRMQGLGGFRRHFVFVFVDQLDLAVLRALRYGQSLRPTEIRAVHFALDDAVARRLESDWARVETTVRLAIVECPDRRLQRAALELVNRTVTDESTEVTVLLPRRIYGPAGFFLHGRSADALAADLSKVSHVYAQIVPFDVAHALSAKPSPLPTRAEEESPSEAIAAGSTPIAQLRAQQRARIEGHVHAVQIAPRSGVLTMECDVYDSTGGIAVLFFGRRQVPGIEPGTRIRCEGTVGEVDGHLAMSNPSYELLPRT